MIYQLKCPNCPMPAGGWGFKDERTGKEWKGIEWNWEMLPKDIIRHRMENTHVYPRGEGKWFNYGMVLQEVFARKHATNPELFLGENGELKLPTETKCACGAADWEEVVCPTCSGRRVTGYRCRKCNATKRL